MPFAAHQDNTTFSSKKLQEYQEKINNLPPSGGGGFHPALLGAANSGRMAGLSFEQIFDDIRTNAVGKRRVPDREIRAAIEKAFTDLRPAAALPPDYAPPPRQPTPPPPQIDLKKLPPTTEAELAAKSPLQIPEGQQQTMIFLQAIFRPGEHIFIGATTDQAEPEKNLRPCSEWLTRTPTGPFYVCNPLTGEEGTTSAGRPSYRAEACVDDHRHLVFEMDGHAPATQLSIVGWLVNHAPVLAVYHSGGKSFHCLLRIDADDADHYRRLVDDARPFLKALGGDPATWHASRLTRLPGASRPDKEGSQLQRLIYLNPAPQKDWRQFMDDAEGLSKPRIKVVTAEELLRLELPPRQNILAPWMASQSLGMIYAPRGVGKTLVSLEISYAVSSGGKFLSWEAPAPKGVLFIDGEMPAVVLQERLANVALSHDKEPAAPLWIVTPDLQSKGMIDLSKQEDQADLEPYLAGVELIVLDNLSTLCRTGRENEGEGWLPVQEWALKQRAAGRSVLFIHHAGKGGQQRGTSRREDVLDTVINLRRTGDYTPDQGAVFEVHFEKARGLYGDELKPFEAKLTTAPDGHQEWIVRALEESTAEKVADLLNEGVPQCEVAEMLGITKGAVSKAKKKAGEAGLLKVS